MNLQKRWPIFTVQPETDLMARVVPEDGTWLFRRLSVHPANDSGNYIATASPGISTQYGSSVLIKDLSHF